MAARDSQPNTDCPIPCAAVNLKGAKVEIHEQSVKGLTRLSPAVRDLVDFLDREGQQRCERIDRLKDRTVTLDERPRKWRVS